jgi:membrane-associated phospholipid phosphatase
MLVYMLSQFRIKSVWDANNAIMGTTWALSLATTFQVALKHFIGGFRPYFLDACAPDVSLARTNNKTGLNGVGFQQVMFTTEICTQTNELLMKDAVTSFPSGHTAGAFAGFVFLSLWLNAKLKAWSNHKPAFWKLALTILPMLAATMIACSLTIDAAHNWYDIVAGAIIGITMAVASYRATYAAVLDWRFNHVPLREDKPFSYGVEMEGGPVSSAMEYTFTRSAGWGASRDLPT